MNRGTIMALENKTAVVLTQGGEFVRVPKLPAYEIGAEITCQVRRNAVRLRRWLQGSVSAAVLLAFFLGFWLMQPPSVVAYVSMDINPSVEFGLDEDMRVRKLRAVNPDAEAFITAIKFKGEDLESVMQAIAEKLVAAHLLTTPSAEIVIASVPMKTIGPNWESQVAEKMKAVLSQAAKRQNDAQAIVGIEVTTISVPLEIRKLANEQGVSSGKMAFWLAAESQGHDIPIDTLKKQSLKKIAADWGGVEKVLGDDDKRKADAKVWKERLDKRKSKLTSSNGNAPSSKPSNDDNDGNKNKDEDDNERKFGAEKKVNDKKSGEREQRKIDKKRKDDEKRIDRQKSKSSDDDDEGGRERGKEREDNSRHTRDNRED